MPHRGVFFPIQNKTKSTPTSSPERAVCILDGEVGRMVVIVSCHSEATPASGIVALSIMADCLTVGALFVLAVLFFE